ncbi:MAG: hypothetical protein HBSAPP03_04640 [Phycisphaerae bacterium]|nr:MAG: hypothetical protein HBSAPP03_04640 [Phycisphaerae bacterium]
MGMLHKPGKKCPQCNGTGVKNARSNMPAPPRPAPGAAPMPTPQAEKCPKCAGKGVLPA